MSPEDKKYVQCKHLFIN